MTKKSARQKKIYRNLTLSNKYYIIYFFKLINIYKMPMHSGFRVYDILYIYIYFSCSMHFFKVWKHLVNFDMNLFLL